MPAVMIEFGNMKNPDDLALLRSEDGQQRLAAALADAAARFTLDAPPPGPSNHP